MIRFFFTSTAVRPAITAVPHLVFLDEDELRMCARTGIADGRRLIEAERVLVVAIARRLTGAKGDLDVVGSTAAYRVFDLPSRVIERGGLST